MFNRIQRKQNNTGIPDTIKQKAENMSGFSLDDVRVHSQSSKPADVGALAYAQGNQIFLGPGQESHLGHELGHVIQQMEGRVSATTSVDGMPLNDDTRLEREADSFSAML